MQFAIYEIEVGGGVIALSPMPERPEDVALIADWGAKFAVSLTEIHEGQTQTLKTQLASFGVRWVNVPIFDFSVPEGKISDQLDVVVADTIVALTEGHKVLFHCMGGCGRSGMAVLRVMHVLGVPNALVKLRNVRPCAIETDAQMVWAMRTVH